MQTLGNTNPLPVTAKNHPVFLIITSQLVTVDVALIQ